MTTPRTAPDIRDESHARALDAADPLRAFRERFHIPTLGHARPVAYMTGNSLGLQPRTTRAIVEQELKDWAELAVEAHFQAAHPWYAYHEMFRDPGDRLAGAKPGACEVVMMNSLTVNLHLLMASFYRPTRERFRIVIERGAFPSDEHAVASQARFHGHDPKDAVLRLTPRKGERTLRTEDIEATLEREGHTIALLLLGGVNYATGQRFDIPRITRAAHAQGVVAGYDLAHAAGNVPLRLHEWNADFAAWCSYKYLNAGPGSLAGCFIHERHHNAALPRLEGWWGTNTTTRFLMRPDFDPGRGAEAWQISNPPVLAAAPLKASLDIFDEAGADALRTKSLALTGYLRALLEQIEGLDVVTPRDDDAHGCQLSIRLTDPGADGRALQKALLARGVVADYREPDTLRLAPVPLYNTYHDAQRAADALRLLTA
ncbi:MAG: kynureninase [Phycisphaerales bacterium]|nr:MAG: kynureninase [Phycisphaerales bacterium]